MCAIHLEHGRAGEEKALAYLKKNGYQILERNYHSAGAEIDIIARIDDIVCFVEVKTRISSAHGAPEEFVDYKKQRHMLRAAKIYATKKSVREFRLRFDIVGVILSGNDATVTHWQDVLEDNEGSG